MDGTILILALSTLAFIAGLGITYWIHSQHRLDILVAPAPPLPEALSNSTPLISVIIPARNEARNIRRCLEALLDQSYPNHELIIVDDRSTDATLQIVEEILRFAQDDNRRALDGPGDQDGSSVRVERGAQDDKRRGQSARRCVVIHGRDPAPGWAGKPHALAQGSEAARGEWLCFIDADTFAGPELLSSTLRAAQAHRADLLSILTDQELGSFWEKVILPVVFTALSFGFPARRVNDPSTPDAIANGQFILIRRSVYEAIGGHAGVHDRIDEDKALAERVKGDGYRLIVADGRAVASTRMYTTLPEIWEGWTKNIFLGMRGRLGLLLFGGVVGLFGALALPFWLIAGLVWFTSTGGLLPAFVAGEAILLWVYLLWMRARAARAMHISILYAFTLPLGALVFTAMIFTSVFRVLSGRGVTWKGRTYKNTGQS